MGLGGGGGAGSGDEEEEDLERKLSGLILLWMGGAGNIGGTVAERERKRKRNGTRCSSFPS